MDDVIVIRGVLQEELERNTRAQLAYRAEIEALPKGSVTVKERGGKRYCYLTYREGRRVRTDYVGIADVVEEDLRIKVEQRRSLEKVLRHLKSEERFMRKALRLK